MNLDELAKKISSVSSNKVVQDLSQILFVWKANDDTVEELKDSVERYLGNTWIASNEEYKKIYSMWSSFRDEFIAGIGGMTMNERLYYFGLLKRFDACTDEDSRLSIYMKLHANP